MNKPTYSIQPPAFLRLLSHPLRWQILLALAQTDLRGQELVQSLDRPQNLVSYHLQKLLQLNIIHEQRSIADGREIYYSLDLGHVRALFLTSGAELHPALTHVTFPEKGEIRQPDSSKQRLRVLFLCTHNSARSQMAEALLRKNGQGQVDVYSAGTNPTEIHALAIRAMAEMKIDIRNHRSKDLTEYIDQHFDYIITLCDRARESCPVFPGDPVRIHWSFPDPSEADGSDSERMQAFREIGVQLNTRIGYLLLVLRKNSRRE